MSLREAVSAALATGETKSVTLTLPGDDEEMRDVWRSEVGWRLELEVSPMLLSGEVSISVKSVTPVPLAPIKPVSLGVFLDPTPFDVFDRLAEEVM